MSVGAGSIKRAAKAAEGSVETKAAEVKAAESGTEVKTEKVAKKTASPKSVVKKAGEKGSADKKASTAGKSAGKPVEPEKNPTAYVAYGIGQELPVHLM